MSEDTSRYAERGISSGKEAVHKATGNLDKGLFPGAFCFIFPDLAGDPEYGSIQHVDGAGTKSSLAYLAALEGSSVKKVWAGIAQDGLVMNVDDVGCVGAFRRMHISQIIGRNRFVISDEAIEAIIAGCKEFCDLLNRLDFDLVYVSGETADLPDLIRTVTVDNAVSTRIKLTDVIDASRMTPGDIIVGFSSTGQAFWENEPNSGMGANGLTNGRHDTLSPYYRTVTESYSPEMPAGLAYRGIYRLTDPLPGDKRFTVGSALLSPTRTYLPLIRKLLELIPREHVHGLIHCSGGGQTKIKKFGRPGNLYVKDNLFPVPPLFAMLQEVSGLPWEQMFAAYNMGHRLEIVIPAEFEEMCHIAASWANLEAQRIGHVEQNVSAESTGVIIKSPVGVFRY